MMSDKGRNAVPPLAEDERHSVLADLELIARGEERDMPWCRVRVLLDHRLATIDHPVLTQGSRTTLNLTNEGLRFMDGADTFLPTASG